jgi:hypothetical protein
MDAVVALAWISGDLLATASMDGTTRLWRGTPSGWLTEACELLERSTETIDLHRETKVICAAHR